MSIYALLSKYVRYMFRFRIVRYGFIGGLCIPVHLLSLACFLYLFGDKLYLLALVCTFEVSTTVNFVLNQLFTYREQHRPGPLGWAKRAFKGQLTSLISQTVTFCVAVTFTYGLHQTPYLGSFVGILSAFFLNYSLSKRFVFLPMRIIKPIEPIAMAAMLQPTPLQAAPQQPVMIASTGVVAVSYAIHTTLPRQAIKVIRPIRLQHWVEEDADASPCLMAE